MKKKTNHNIETKPRKKVRNSLWLGKMWRQFPPTNAMIETLADEYMDTVREDEEILTIYDYVVKKGVTQSVWYDYIKKYPVLAEAHDFVKMCIAARRERGAMKRTLDSSAVFKAQSFYSPTYKEALRFNSELRLKDEDIPSNQKLTIVMQPFPTTDIVPPKKVRSQEDEGERNEGRER